MTARFGSFTDRDMLELRSATERERMAAHYNHDAERGAAAKKKLRAIENEIERRRHINRENRKRSP